MGSFGGDGRMLAGRYRLVAPLGRGGMGTVWRAVDELLGRAVAVKELHPEDGLSGLDARMQRERTLREARTLAQLKHPNVIVLHDVVEGDEDRRPWIVMELVDGESLADRLAASGPVEPREAARIVAALLGALRVAHASGVLHRDIKPANVLMEAGTGRVVLTDFGIAQVSGVTTITETGSFVGSPEYTAPERMSGRRTGPESDLWSLGVLLCALVSGESPFRRDSLGGVLHAVVFDEIRPPAAAGPLLPVIEGLLDRDWERRLDGYAAERLLRDCLAAGDTPELPVAYAVEYWGDGRPGAAAGSGAAGGAGAPAGAAGGPAPGAGPYGAEPETPYRGGGAVAPGAGSPAGPAGDGARHLPGARPAAAAGPGPAGAAGPPPPGPAGPGEPEPPGAARGRAPAGRRRSSHTRTAVLTAVAVVALIGVGAGAAALLLRGGGSGADASDGRPDGKTSLRPSGPAADGGERTGKDAGKSGKPDVGGSGEVPDGYTLVSDPAGFRVAVPEGFERSYEPPRVYYYSPGKEFRIGIHVQSRDPKGPLQLSREADADGPRNYPGYRGGQVIETEYRGLPAALWAFVWDGAADDGGSRQTYELSWDEGTRMCDVWVSAPVSQKGKGKRYFDTAVATFDRPGGTVPGNG
ncbi:serine/threonine-protein kinase [Streptomyces sp. NPDC018031]|uniref:serine/threonine-protein kinase n=1 Tax=Streptomyces sp. NPDC018031 TaxID=3365033 RepID=UPI00379DF8DB